MTDVIKIKGLDISLKGGAFPEVQSASYTENYALCPTDFHGLIPGFWLRRRAGFGRNSPCATKTSLRFFLSVP